jgi:hypothetical protein
MLESYAERGAFRSKAIRREGIVPKTKAPSSVAQDGAKVTEGRVWVNPSAAKQFGGAEIVPVDRQPGAGDGFAGVARAYFCVLIFRRRRIGPSSIAQSLTGRSIYD